MGTRSFDGCRVIEAAERHLACADRSEAMLREQVGAIKTQEAALRGQLDAIRAQLRANETQLKATERQLAAAQCEVKEATHFLEETRENLQVIDVDMDDSVEIGGRKLKTKASLLHDDPENGDGKKALVDPSTDNGDTSKSIVVNGAGTPEANGTYRRFCFPDGCPTWVERTFPVWSKDGQWKGKATEFYIFRFRECWWVYCDNDRGASLYRCCGKGKKLPSTSGWLSTTGIDPPPRLEWQKHEVTNDRLNSCDF